MTSFPRITLNDMARLAPDLFRVSPEYSVIFESTFAERHAHALAELTSATITCDREDQS